MNVIRTALADVLLFEPKVFGDERGFFFESYNKRAFREATLPMLAESIVSAAAIVFLFCVTSFGVVLVLRFLVVVNEGTVEARDNRAFGAGGSGVQLNGGNVTLRNVAIRRVFFHNGQMRSLRDVIRFYNTRDTNPELWYPVVDGIVQKFDDLPVRYRANIDTQAPLDGRAHPRSPVRRLR